MLSFVGCLYLLSLFFFFFCSTFSHWGRCFLLLCGRAMGSCPSLISTKVIILIFSIYLNSCYTPPPTSQLNLLLLPLCSYEFRLPPTWEKCTKFYIRLSHTISLFFSPLMTFYFPLPLFVAQILCIFHYVLLYNSIHFIPSLSFYLLLSISILIHFIHSLISVSLTHSLTLSISLSPYLSVSLSSSILSLLSSFSLSHSHFTHSIELSLSISHSLSFSFAVSYSRFYVRCLQKAHSQIFYIQNFGWKSRKTKGEEERIWNAKRFCINWR